MSFIRKLERKLGRWAIPNLTTIIIAGQVLLYFMVRIELPGNQGFDLSLIWLLPGKVMQGEIWRLLTFVFLPPGQSPIFVIFYWYLFFLYGTSLEREWGTIRYNIFLWISYVATVAASFVIWAWQGDAALMMAHSFVVTCTHGHCNANLFLYGSVFLAFARLYPDFILRIFFILPIRIKWLALILWISFGYVFLSGNGAVRLVVVASLLNYLLFFGREHWRDFKSGNRRRAFQSKVRKASRPILHQCLICELNSENSPRTLFRYCSKCDGQCCYCPEHIQNHEHVVADDSSLAGKS